jgi:hypothetical protein
MVVVGLVDLVALDVARLLGLDRVRLLAPLLGLAALVALGLVELGRLARLVGLERLEPLVLVGLVVLVDLGRDPRLRLVVGPARSGTLVL